MQTTAQQVIGAINAHNYALAAVLALVAVVAIIRKVAPLLHGGFGVFLNSKRGGSLLVLIGGACGALVTALAAGTHLTLSLCVGAIMTAASASGVWNIVRDVYGISVSDAPKKLADTVTTPTEPPPSPPSAA